MLHYYKLHGASFLLSAQSIAYPHNHPLSSHSHYRYPAGGTRSTTGSSTAGDSTGVVQVPEELLRPLIPNQANSPNMYTHNAAPASSTASSSLYRNNYNR